MCETRGGVLLTRLWIGVCSPGWHTLTLPRQKFPLLPRKKGNITTLARILVSNQDQNTPLARLLGPQYPSQTETVKNVSSPDYWAENSILPRQKLWKTYPWGLHLPSTQGIARAPPPRPLGMRNLLVTQQRNRLQKHSSLLSEQHIFSTDWILYWKKTLWPWVWRISHGMPFKNWKSSQLFRAVVRPL